MQLQNTLHDELLSDIQTIEKDERLYRAKNFTLRLRAIDHLEFHVIDRIDALPTRKGDGEPLGVLQQYARKVKYGLDGVDIRMFNRLRSQIAQEGYKGGLLLDLIGEHVDQQMNTVLQQDDMGYDDLDVFLNGLLTDRAAPVETIDREPEMVFYQKTPARIILELIKKAAFNPHDVFFDLGSGLGQVVMLVNMLAGVVAKGVEFEPAFCSYAKHCASSLGLTNISFINADARHADYSSGTIFFMYTPFGGTMLQDVLQRLAAVAGTRQIKLFTYGPCTPVVAQQGWLINRSAAQRSADALGEFISV